MSVDEEQVYRSANGARSTVWRHDADRGVFILADSDGHEHATFGSHDAIFSDADPYPATESDIKDEGGDDWKRVERPIIPERVFGGDPPIDDMWDVIVVPSGATRRISRSSAERRQLPSRRSRTTAPAIPETTILTL